MRELQYTNQEFYELIKNKTISELSLMYFKLIEVGDLKRASVVDKVCKEKEKHLLKGVVIC